jgi:hypothetical protein
MVRQMGTSVTVASTVRNDLTHDAVPKAWWHLVALRPTRNTICMIGTQGTICTPSSFTLPLSSTFALFLFLYSVSSSVSDNWHLSPFLFYPLLFALFLLFPYCFLPRRKINGRPTRRTRGPPPTKNQREVDEKNAWNLTTIYPLHLCGVNLMQMNFLEQGWQCRYNVTLRRFL